MTYQSVIRNFVNINIEQAKRLREQLSLSMPPQMLQFCANYYKNYLKRDPFVDELKMLDMLVSSREANCSFVALTELLANDTFAARTYADMLKKRKQLYPNLTRPCTLGEAANLASEYIRRARGESGKPRSIPSIENVRDSITYPDATCVAAPNSAYRLRIFPVSQTELSEGDILLLTSPLGDDTQAAFRRKSAALLRNKTVMQYLKGASTVGRDGILAELLNLSDGALIHLPALSPIGTSAPVTTLCEGFAGSQILRVSPHQLNIVASLLAKGGVRAVPFAAVKKEPQFVFMRNKQSSFALDAHFLRTLNCYRAACAKLKNEANSTPDVISFGGVGGGKCTYLSPESAAQIGEVAETGSTACVAASSSLKNSPYKTALWSVLAPVASLCAHGVPYTDQSLSVAVEFPEDLENAETVGSCTSAILGLYRAQMELGIATAGRIHTRTTKGLDAPAVSVWATAQNIQKSANTFAKSGSFVYAVTPKLDKDGLPDFQALRQMLGEIAKFAKNGSIISSRVLVGEAITDGIRKMKSTFTCTLSDKSIAAGDKLPLCILIESQEDLPLSLVGKVQPCRQPAPEAIEIPERTELIACERPDIVIVSTLLDSDAMALAAYLEERGAQVSLFAEPEKDAMALSRTILTTQTLILCQNAKLPETKQMKFALDSLRRAGGILLSLSKNTAPEGFISPKNGIDEGILQKICL